MSKGSNSPVSAFINSVEKYLIAGAPIGPFTITFP